MTNETGATGTMSAGSNSVTFAESGVVGLRSELENQYSAGFFPQQQSWYETNVVQSPFNASQQGQAPVGRRPRYILEMFK